MNRDSVDRVRGRFDGWVVPDEISGRGVRYTPQGQLDETSDADGDVPERLDELEQVVAMVRRQLGEQ